MYTKTVGRCNRLSSLVVVAVLLGVAVVCAPAARGWASFYVIPGASKVGTPIRSVPYTISKSGTYYLDGNLTMTNTTASAAISIQAGNVVLNMNGFTLTGPGTGTGSIDGIYVDGSVSNVQVMHGTVTNFSRSGVMFEESGLPWRRSVVNVVSWSNNMSGLYVQGLLSRVEDCVAYNNGVYGIYTNRGGIIEGNQAYGNFNNGINATSGAIIKNNQSQWNRADGIVCSGGGCSIIGNTADHNYHNGIVTGNWSTVNGNTATSNDVYSQGYNNIAFGTSGVADGFNVP